MASRSYSLNLINAAMFANILEESLAALKILDRCNGPLQIRNTEAQLPRLRAAKFGLQQQVISDELDAVTSKDYGIEENELEKLIIDRKFVYDVMFMTYKDLVQCYSFKSLAKQLFIRINQDWETARLTLEEANNRVIRRDLMRQLRTQRNRNLTAKYDLDIKIDHLRAQVEESNLNVESQSRYLGRWQAARAEQHRLSILGAEAGPGERAARYKQQIDDETRIHSEFMFLIRIAINETINKMEEAMNRYNEHMEDIDLQIQIMKNKYLDQVAVRKKMEEKYNIHKNQCQEWLAFKKAREDDRIYSEKMTLAASVVQAWWRGLLVRRQLGPYRPPKQKPALGNNLSRR